MANVQGKLAYDEKRMNQDTRGIQNVPIVLQQIPFPGATQGLTIAATTNENGDYTFRNVPAGEYQVVEYYGYQPAPTSSDVNFGSATTQDIITTGGKTPPISYSRGAPAGATHLDGVNETTQKITVGVSDTRVNTIHNGPVKYTGFDQALDAQGIKVTDQNLVSGGGFRSFSGDSGTFGTYSQGTKVDTKEQPEPYRDMDTAFTRLACRRPVQRRKLQNEPRGRSANMVESGGPYVRQRNG